MQTYSFFNPLTSPGALFSGTLRQPKKSYNNDHNRLITTMAFKKDGRSGKIVDENMIVLRERIREIKAETECGGDDDQLPENWMQWEKTYICSGDYHSDVYKLIAVLQQFLIESRPSVALGLLAVFAFGGSTAAVTVLRWLINSVEGN